MSDTSQPPLRAAQAPRSSKPSHVRTIVALILREMASRYGRTPGGYIWALLEPLGMIVMLSVGFALMLRNPPLGSSFIMFYATGHLVYTLFLRTSAMVMSALGYSRNLLAYPAVTWIDAVLARLILNILTQVLVAYILLLGIMEFVDHRSALDFKWILIAFSVSAILGTGVGLINCVLVSFFPVWKNVWSILTRPLFLASGVIWIYEELPAGAQDVLWWNPLVHVTGMARKGFFSVYDPQHLSINLVVIPGLVLTALGLVLLKRYHLWIINSR